MTVRALVRTGLIVAVLAVAVVAGVLGWRVYSGWAAERDTAAAVDAARTRTAMLLSYSAPTLDADLARARQQVTGDFAQRHQQLADALIGPSTRERGIITRATVARVAVIEASPDRVVTLLYVNQSTTSTAQPTPWQATNQARVTMTKVDGNWLVADLTPI